MPSVTVVNKIFQLVCSGKICFVSVAYPQGLDIKDRVTGLGKIVGILGCHAKGSEQCREELAGLDFALFTSKGVGIETKRMDLSHLLCEMLLSNHFICGRIRSSTR